MAVALKYKCGSLYDNTKIGVPLHTTLGGMNWTQGITQMKTDKLTADGIIKIALKKNNHAPWKLVLLGIG